MTTAALHLGQGPGQLTVRLDRGDATTLLATRTGGAWDANTALQFLGDAAVYTIPGAVTGDTVTWALSAADVLALLTAVTRDSSWAVTTSRTIRVRLIEGDDQIAAAGVCTIGDGWSADTGTPQQVYRSAAEAVVVHVAAGAPTDPPPGDGTIPVIGYGSLYLDQSTGDLYAWQA